MGQLPKHIAIIMDGNGRWATKRNLPRVAGHRAGAKVVRPIVTHCAQRGVEVLSLFAFSLENRARPPAEVHFLMRLMLKFLQRDTVALHENNVRLRVIGDRSYLDDSLKRQVEAAETLTKNNTGLTLIIAINYSGQWDIAQATQKLLLQPQLVTDVNSLDSVGNVLAGHLSFADLPAPDLFIRTSGEQRISNFMLWQLAYSELYFPKMYWPDFNTAELDAAIDFYQGRHRRFGLTPEQVEEYAET